jgi:hypothetical protein
MIVSRGRNYIFVHAPKTGGTSMALALEARAMKDDIMLGDTPKAVKRRRRLKDVQVRGRLWKHATLADIDGLVTPSEIAEMFTFTLVRNPWDRMVSYYHWLKVQSFDHPAVALAGQVDFAHFVMSDLVALSMKASPARFYMTDAGGDEHCKAYVRIEHFEQDATPLMEHLGFDLTLPKSNASQRALEFRSYYDSATRDKVALVCEEDIKRFGYAFD